MQVVQAFVRGIASQFHPAMLALLLGPFLLSVVLGAIGAWLLWDPLIGAMQTVFFDASGQLRWVFAWAGAWGGVEFLRRLLSALVLLLLIIPLLFAFALMLVAVLAMPVVTRHLGNGAYKDVERRGSWSIAGSAWNAVSSFLMFVVGYLITIPLWLIPPLAFVVPWFWWSWLTARILRFDSLVEHASPEERTELMARYKKDTFGLSLMVTALNYIPPLFILTPVLSALMFSHYSLGRLRHLRAQSSATAPSPAAPLPGPAR